VGFMKFISDIDAARLADSKLGLQERLSTAIELSKKKVISQMAELQLVDAANSIRSMDLKVAFPHVFPITAKILPLAFIVLVILSFIPPLYSSSTDDQPAVKYAINKTGIEIENTAKEAYRDFLADDLRKVALEMKQTGGKLQEKNITKKEALKNLSNLSLKMESLKILGKLSKELEGNLTPEEKRIINESLSKLSENLRDIQGMEEISKKIIKAQQMGLSQESLNELAAALNNMRYGNSDMKSLERISDDIAKAKYKIGRLTPALVQGADSEDINEESSGLIGGNAPGKDSMKEGGVSSSDKNISGQGYESELTGQMTEEGRSMPVNSDTTLMKGESTIPYQKIYIEYKNMADDAIGNTKIPWAYREQIKNYFDGIKGYTHGDTGKSR